MFLEIPPYKPSGGRCVGFGYGCRCPVGADCRVCTEELLDELDIEELGDIEPIKSYLRGEDYELL